MYVPFAILALFIIPKQFERKGIIPKQLEREGIIPKQFERKGIIPKLPFYKYERELFAKCEDCFRKTLKMQNLARVNDAPATFRALRRMYMMNIFREYSKENE